jgi:hypothetical protein
MKPIIIGLLACSATLVACGSESSLSAGAVEKHFFDQDYGCHREREVTSKKTGKTRTVKYLSYYSPKKGWRIDLSDVKSNSFIKVANLHTPSARYDGVYKEDNGVVTGVKFSSAWPYDEAKPSVALGRLAKTKKSNCSILSDTSIFDIDYLDSLEVMGQ